MSRVRSLQVRSWQSCLSLAAALPGPAGRRLAGSGWWPGGGSCPGRSALRECSVPMPRRVRAPPSRMFLMFSKVFVDELDGGGAFADGRGDAFDRAVADVAGGEDA